MYLLVSQCWLTRGTARGILNSRQSLNDTKHQQATADDADLHRCANSLCL